jgi:hypothetical protein
MLDRKLSILTIHDVNPTCSEKTKGFYEKSGLKLSKETLVMKMKLGDFDLSTS